LGLQAERFFAAERRGAGLHRCAVALRQLRWHIFLLSATVASVPGSCAFLTHFELCLSQPSPGTGHPLVQKRKVSRKPEPTGIAPCGNQSHFFLGLMRSRVMNRRNMMAKKNSPVWVYLTVLLAAMVGLAMTPLAAAQNPAEQNPAMQQGQQQQQSVTATGCLQKATSGSGYQLTDSSTMKAYDLTAASSDVDLSAHVGHTVTVTGTPTAASASS